MGMIFFILHMKLWVHQYFAICNICPNLASLSYRNITMVQCGEPAELSMPGMN